MRQWINKNIIALSMISLLDDFAYELVIAVLPAYLISINSSAATFGLIVGIANAFSFLKIISGKLSDKFNSHKLFASIGYSLSTLNFFILQLTSTWINVFIAWIISGIGKSTRDPARNALLIESTSKKYYGRVFGFHRTFDSFGAILGPTCALILISRFTFKEIFIFSFLLSFTALLVLILFVNETSKHKKLLDFKLNMFNLKSMPYQFKKFLIASLIFSLGNFANSLLIFRTIELLVHNGFNQFNAQKYSILFYTLYNICYMISSYPAGHLADVYGTKKILNFGYLLTAIVSFVFMFQINTFVIVLLFILAGVCAAITNSLTHSMTASLIDENIHGIGFGIQLTISGLAFMIANFMVGILWTKFSAFYGFFYSAILCFLGTLTLFYLKEE